MAKRELHSMAVEMRKQGMSYSKIKSELGVSKSTLSNWLYDLPLTQERISELRDNSEVRIERCRDTKLKKKNTRLDKVYERVSLDIASISNRELFLCGLFLYWGEGDKTKGYRVAISNTDSSIILCFKKWLSLLGVVDGNIKVRLQLYRDMDIDAEIEYWSVLLDIPRQSFRKPHIKTSNRAGLTHEQKFTHGTCNLIYDNRDIAEYVHTAIDWLQNCFIATDDKI